jgi:hypothetical protein
VKEPRNRLEQVIQFVDKRKVEWAADLSPADAETLLSYTWEIRDGRGTVIDQDGASIDPFTITPACVRDFWRRIPSIVKAFLEVPDDAPDSYQLVIGKLAYLHDDKEKASVRDDAEWQQYRAKQIDVVQDEQHRLVIPAIKQVAGIKKTKRANWEHQAIALQTDRERLMKANATLPPDLRRSKGEIDQQLQDKYDIKKTQLYNWLKFKS